MRLAPPTRGGEAYFAYKRDTRETLDPAKPSGPTRRAFAETKYKEERAKTKTRDRIPSEERDTAREIRRLERELRAKENLRMMHRSRSPEVIPEHLRPPASKAEAEEGPSSPNADQPAKKPLPSKAPPASVTHPKPAKEEPPRNPGPAPVSPAKARTPSTPPKAVVPTPESPQKEKPSTAPQATATSDTNPTPQPVETFKEKGKGGMQIILGRPAKRKWKWENATPSFRYTRNPKCQLPTTHPYIHKGS